MLPCLWPLAQLQEAPPPPDQQHSPPSPGLLVAPWDLHLPRVRGRKTRRETKGKVNVGSWASLSIRRERTQCVESLRVDGVPGSQPGSHGLGGIHQSHQKVIPQTPVLMLFKNGTSGSSSKTDSVLRSAVYSIADISPGMCLGFPRLNP